MAQARHLRRLGTFCAAGRGRVLVVLRHHDKLTPYSLWEELVEKKNVAVAIVVGSMCIAIGLIVSAAVHG